MVLLITCDLRAPGRNYNSLYEAIKKANVWWHHLDSTWLIETNAAPKAWYEFLAPHLDVNDYILIIEVKHNYWGFLPKEAWDWLSGRTY